jgi:mRNA interferase MazF
MRRGEVWWVARGVYASKPRPAVVIQNDRFDGTDSVTVCPFTTTATEAPLLRLTVSRDDANGLESDSQLMIDKVTTVRRSHLIRLAGKLSPKQLVEVERLLLVFLGLAD